jgi:hypothetical protein
VNFLLLPEEGQQSPGLQRWARLRMNIRNTLRRGGWYQVLSAGAEEVVLQVRGAPTILSRDVVEIVDTRPETWSMVPIQWGGPYLVCPDCAERVRPAAVSARFPCPRCRKSFTVLLECDIAS